MNALAAIGYPLFVVAAMNFCLAAFLLRGPRRDGLVPYVAAVGLVNTVYCTVMGLAYVRASLGVPYDVYYRSAWVGWLGLAPVLQIVLHLKGDGIGARRWGAALYAVWGTILVLCWTTDLVETGAVSLVPFVDRTGPLEEPARALGALTLAYALLEMYRVRRASIGRRRQQVGYFLLGLAIYAAAGLLLAGVVQIVGPVHIDPGLVCYFSAVWMAATVYAIRRHRLFDIRFVVWRAVVALLLTALLVASSVVLFGWVAPLVGSRPGVLIVSLVAAVAFFMTPLVEVVRSGTARLFLRHRYDYQRAVKESAEALASLVAVDDVLRRLFELTRRTVGATSGVLLLRDGDRFRPKQAYGPDGAGDGLGVDSALVRWLTDQPGAFVREEQELALSAEQMVELEGDLRRFQGELALPIRSRGEVLGILILGHKSDRDAFLQADVDLLETLANEAAIALTNARLVEELQQSVHARDDFLSVAGHELRTPLTALDLNVQILLRSPPDAARVRERLLTIERQVTRLAHLTNEVLDVSRIRAQRLALERESSDLGAVVRDVAGRFADELARARSPLDLQLANGVVGSWDRSRIEQVVTNLISNAIKYGAARPIRVTVERAGGRARLTVRDEGIGIEPADQRRIFDRFERAVKPEHFGGFGLGLWITRELVQAHGGTIRVESARGAGSTFLVELPLA